MTAGRAQPATAGPPTVGAGLPREAGDRGGDPLVGRGERRPYVPGALGAVELPRPDEDAQPGEGLHGVPAGFVAGQPEVETGLGMVDTEAVRLEGGAQGLAAAGVPLPLLLDVLVVLERDRHRGLYGRRHHRPSVR